MDLTLPTSVTLSAGSSSASFEVHASDAPRSATLTATYNGFSKSVKLSDAAG